MRRFLNFLFIYALAIFIAHLLLGDWPWLTQNVQAAGGTTYYIDYVAGSNSFDGTEKTHTTGVTGPWKSAPGMQQGASCGGATHAYTASPGDQIIFKGGVTWPAACFQFLFPYPGSSAAPIYVGVDKTWFTGGSWTRPIFDLANSFPGSGAGAAIRITQPWVTMDNIELKRLLIQSGAIECAGANIDGANSSGTVTIENFYIHDWTITALTNGSTGHATGSICQSGGSTVNAIGNTISDQGTTASVPFGACFRNLVNVENNDCEYVGEGEVGHFGNTDGNIFANMNGNVIPDPANHTNVIEASGSQVGDGPIYNNLIHDTNSGVTIFECNSANVYNNVMWNNSNYSIMTDSNCPGATSSTVTNVYNNTVDCSSSAGCFRIVYRAGSSIPGVLNLQNNHWITNGTAACYNNIGSGCGNVASGTQTPNLTMSTATAAAQGYNVTGKYAPISGSGGTVGVGANLTSSCSGGLAALCTDTSGAPWFGGSLKSRPTGSAAWDDGAYQWQGGSTGPPSISITSPTPGTISGIVSLTATCTPQGSATCTSVQYTIDGFPYGAAQTVSPYTLAWNTVTASNARAHIISATATDSNGQTSAPATASVTPTNSHPNGFVSDSLWAPGIPNQTFTAQTSGTITYPICITPYTSTTNDNEVGVSQALPTGYGDFAAIIAVRAGGYIQVYQGTGGVGYTTDGGPTAYPVSAGTQYCFNWAINMTAKTYTVTETSPSAVTIATNFGFRLAATSIGFLSAYATNNSTPDTVEVANFAVPATPALSFSPGNLSFGNVVDTTTAMMTDAVTIVNPSATITNAVVAGTGFSFATSTCPQPSGTISASCNYMVSFTPPSAGNYSGTLTITGNQTGSPQVYNLSGTGIAAAPTITPSPLSLSFGNVQLSNPPVTAFTGPVTVTITNPPTTFVSVAPTGGDAADFGVSSNACVSTVSVTTCQTIVKFSPSKVGTESTTLVYTSSDATNSPQNVGLTAIGVSPSGPVAPSESMFMASVTKLFQVPVSFKQRFTGTVPFTAKINFTCTDCDAVKQTCSSCTAQ